MHYQSNPRACQGQPEGEVAEGHRKGVEVKDHSRVLGHHSSCQGHCAQGKQHGSQEKNEDANTGRNPGEGGGPDRRRRHHPGEKNDCERHCDVTPDIDSTDEIAHDEVGQEGREREQAETPERKELPTHHLPA